MALLTKLYLHVNFTPKETEVLKHRAEIPDCMAEVFGPDNENHWGLSLDATEERIIAILHDLFRFNADGSSVAHFRPHDPDHKLILTELVEGNTMGAIVQDMLDHHHTERTHKTGRAWAKHLRSIETKYESIGLTVQFNT